MICWFMGTGEFARLCLDGLIKEGLVPSKIVTMPPRKGGRGMKLKETPVDLYASEKELSIYRTADINKDVDLLRALSEEKPDVIFVIDFGQKVKDPYLSVPRYGCLNVHPSLLPLYRGAAPVQRAIMDGCEETGVTVFRLVEEMDAGPILTSEIVQIGENESSSELLFRLAYIGSAILNRGVKLLGEGNISFQEQNSKLATYAHKIEKNETKLNPNQTSTELHHRVMALTSSLGSYMIFRKKRLKIWATEIFDTISTGRSGEISFCDGYPLLQSKEGKLKLLEVQPEGKKRLDAREWLKGYHLEEGELLE